MAHVGIMGEKMETTLFYNPSAPSLQVSLRFTVQVLGVSPQSWRIKWKRKWKNTWQLRSHGRGGTIMKG